MGMLAAIGRASPEIRAIQQDYDMGQQRAIENTRSDAEEKRKAIMFQQQQADYLEKQKQLDMPIPLDTIAQKVGGEYPSFFKGFVELGKQHGVVEDINGTQIIRKRNLPILSEQMKFGTEVGNMQMQNILKDTTNKWIAVNQELQNNQKLKPEQRDELMKKKTQLESDRQHLLFTLDPEFQKKMELERVKYHAPIALSPDQTLVNPGTGQSMFKTEPKPRTPKQQAEDTEANMRLDMAAGIPIDPQAAQALGIKIEDGQAKAEDIARNLASTLGKYGDQNPPLFNFINGTATAGDLSSYQSSSGNPSRYQNLMKALNDTKHPLHEEAKVDMPKVKQLYGMLDQSIGMKQQAAASPQISTSPPVHLLKEGVRTNFNNGQTWTLQNGKPVRIK